MQRLQKFDATRQRRAAIQADEEPQLHFAEDSQNNVRRT